MTSEATVAVSEPSEAPKWWATYTLEGREIHFVAPTPEQLMVLRRLARQLSTDEKSAGKTITTMAMILDAVSACMSSDEERDYTDQLVLDRKIGLEELAGIIKAALSGPDKKEAPKNGPAKRVRRR